MSEAASTQAESSGGTPADQAIEQVRHALRGLQYGQVLVIVQDGVVVQIDRTERRRLRGTGRS